MTEGDSKQERLQQRIHSLVILELDQQRDKAFVDRHRERNKKLIRIGKAVLVFTLSLDRAVLDSLYRKGDIHARHTR